MIEIKNLSKRFQNNIVLDNINIEIKKGEVVAVIGPSGTGKSTLIRCIDRLERPESGVLKMEGLEVDLSKKSKNEVLELRKRMSMVFQQFNLFEKKTALQNVMEGLVQVKKIPKNEAEEIAYNYLKKVGMKDRAYYYPKHLSGGQKQRVAIARALAMGPELLLLDEPTSALDPELVGEVLETIKQAASEGYTMLLVSHEMRFVRNVATKVIFLEGGKIVEQGDTRIFFDNPKTQRTKEFLASVNQLPGPEYMI